MQYERFKKLVAGTSLIVCYNRYPDMPGGWNKEMDDLVGKFLIVEQKDNECVYVRHDSGTRYSFHYEYIEEISQSTTIKWRDKTFTSCSIINIKILNAVALKEDALEFGRAFGSSNRTINNDLLDFLSKKCPRVVGVLLSNKLLIEC